ncbi:hypothetical protein BDF21DRAFT_448667 [Thamnidium elegans]|nr:hypothetical protein BDF21DRAFT_448667 [Thamnidium elegans]
MDTILIMQPLCLRAFLAAKYSQCGLFNCDIITVSNTKRTMRKGELRLVNCIQTSTHTKYANILFNIMTNLQSNGIESLKEDLYSDSIVKPLLCPFLPTFKYTTVKKLLINHFNRNSQELVGSKVRRGSHGHVPDLSLTTKLEGQKQRRD